MTLRFNKKNQYLKKEDETQRFAININWNDHRYNKSLSELTFYIRHDIKS